MSDPEPQPTDVPPPTPLVTDLRTGTEVAPEVITHYAEYLQGAPYDNPYPEPPPATKQEPPPAQEAPPV